MPPALTASKTGLPHCPECKGVALKFVYGDDDLDPPTPSRVVCSECWCEPPPDYPLAYLSDEPPYEHARRVWSDPAWRRLAAEAAVLRFALRSVVLTVDATGGEALAPGCTLMTQLTALVRPRKPLAYREV